VFEALQPWVGRTGMAVLHPGRGNKGARPDGPHPRPLPA
jgi:hypothetical protein